MESLRSHRAQTGVGNRHRRLAHPRVPSTIQERVRGCSTLMNQSRRVRRPGCNAVASTRIKSLGHCRMLFSQGRQEKKRKIHAYLRQEDLMNALDRNSAAVEIDQPKSSSGLLSQLIIKHKYENQLEKDTGCVCRNCNIYHQCSDTAGESSIWPCTRTR